MKFELPSTARIKEIGAELGFPLDEPYLDQVLTFMAPFGDAFNAVGALPDHLPAVKYPRQGWRRPTADENKYGAWYVKIAIPGAGAGRLAGRTVAVKDTVCLAGVPMMNGASVLEGYVPEMDATIVTRLLDAGAVILGKSVCEYFSVSGGSYTSASSVVHSPRNPGYTPGGSSTGSAALVAARDVDMGIGGDQAGSIRIPASYSGVVGIKPTFGLVPDTGIMGIEATIIRRSRSRAAWARGIGRSASCSPADPSTRRRSIAPGSPSSSPATGRRCGDRSGPRGRRRRGGSTVRKPCRGKRRVSNDRQPA
jgi:amidase